MYEKAYRTTKHNSYGHSSCGYCVTMRTTTSKDGTSIAYDVYGDGQPVIIVSGTMNSRTFGPAPAAQLLGKDFAVYDYDRRGRGDSGDNRIYTPEKEVEDIAALIQAAGGQAALCGYSAGAALAMEAAIRLGPKHVTKLAMYEGPYSNDPQTLAEWKAYGKALHKSAEADDTSKMIAAFTGLVHAEDQLGTLRKDKVLWGKLSKLAPTLLYDYELIGPTKKIPAARLANLAIPALVICGGNSGAGVIADTEHIAKLIPHGSSVVLPGQSHSVEPAAIAPVLRSFFAA